MNVKDFYKSIDGNYEDLYKRLSGNEAFIYKWIKKFGNDPTYQSLETAMDSNDYEQILKAAHTLKGVCANLSFIKLFDCSAELVAYLKTAGTSPDKEMTETLFNSIKAEYDKMQNMLQELE